MLRAVTTHRPAKEDGGERHLTGFIVQGLIPKKALDVKLGHECFHKWLPVTQAAQLPIAFSSGFDCPSLMLLE